MELILTNHSSYPRIGDNPEYQLLRRTIAQWEKGGKTEADRGAAEDRLTELALTEQIEAGLDLVTDGQIRWYDPISHLAGKLSGVRVNGLLRLFDTNFYFRQPVVRGPIGWSEPLLVSDFLFAKAQSFRPVKAVLTGPYTLARLSIPENGQTGGLELLLEGYTAALAQEVGALADAGATIIQVDEPSLLKHPQDFVLFARSVAALAARKGQARLALSVYFGDVAPLYERLQSLPADILGFDFIYSPQLVELIAVQGSNKTLALGLVDGRNTRLEDLRVVVGQLEKITRKLEPNPVYLSPSCGLEYLPRDRAQLKLRHLTTIKNTFAGSRQ
jgi:5-methyltetrahydropteroyltriglutamate--homocysteine methyltransferase